MIPIEANKRSSSDHVIFLRSIRRSLVAGALGVLTFVASGVTPTDGVFSSVAGAAIIDSPLGIDGAPVQVVDRELLIRLRPGFRHALRSSFLAEYGFRLEREAMPGGWFKVRTPEPQAIAQWLRRMGRGRAMSDVSGLRELLERLRQDPRVAAASPNAICRVTTYEGGRAPSDRYYAHQWNLEMLDMEAAWSIEHGTAAPEDVLIAVLDTGVAWRTDLHEPSGLECVQHRDLSPAFAASIDFVDDCANGSDLNQHGTHVAGIIHGEIDNGVGIAGMAPFFTVAPVRILDEQGQGTVELLVDGINHVINQPQPFKVMNLSVAFPPNYDPGPYLESAIQEADEQGIVIVAAAGNKAFPKVAYPAAYNEVIAVGAVDRNALRTPYSNYGAALDVMAPGGVEADVDGNGYPDAILSTAVTHQDPTDVGYWFSAGTSQAAPHVSALAALILSNSSGQALPLSALDVRNIIVQTAKDLGDPGWDSGTGYGLIDPFRALSEWPSIVSVSLDDLGGFATPEMQTLPLMPKGQFGVVLDLPSWGAVLFIEVNSNLFCIFDYRVDQMMVWRFADFDLAGITEYEGGLIGLLDAAGGLKAVLGDHATYVGDINLAGGIISLLDETHGITSILEMNGGISALLDAPNESIVAMIEGGGGIMGMIDGSGTALDMLHSSGGLIAILEASGGLLGMLDASGGIIAFLDASGKRIGRLELECSAAGQLVRLGDQ